MDNWISCPRPTIHLTAKRVLTSVNRILAGAGQYKEDRLSPLCCLSVLPLRFQVLTPGSDSDQTRTTETLLELSP
ncbi:hypothetical protein AMECASPLE_007702 [Ameca splendens]|uniref:Uncharacterized protein n=1 Tax=Ameca splendens TaxID=208324 RepID=A0ABV0XZQ0_9TELE